MKSRERQTYPHIEPRPNKHFEVDNALGIKIHRIHQRQLLRLLLQDRPIVMHRKIQRLQPLPEVLDSLLVPRADVYRRHAPAIRDRLADLEHLRLVQRHLLVRVAPAWRPVALAAQVHAYVGAAAELRALRDGVAELEEVGAEGEREVQFPTDGGELIRDAVVPAQEAAGSTFQVIDHSSFHDQNP